MHWKFLFIIKIRWQVFLKTALAGVMAHKSKTQGLYFRIEV